MADQIILAWTVDVANTTFGPAAAGAALAAVELYENTTTDPVLGQKFGLTVEDDTTTTDATSATRTLTLNMNAVNTPTAPPPFPCRPRTSTPPVLPYPLRESVPLPGAFVPANGSMSVSTTETQIPSVSVGDFVQFLSQEGVFYEVASVTSTTIGLTTAFTGTSGTTTASKEIAAPVTLAAIYSTSELDTGGVSTTPAIAAGPGARTVSIVYNDSTGAGGPYTSTVTLNGKRPVAIPLAMGSVDIAEIVNIIVATSGSFGNSLGELTLVELSSALPAIPTGIPLGTGIGSIEGSAPAIHAENSFKALTDEAQLLIGRHLAYLPPSYFSVAAQQSSAPQLAGDFFVTTGSTNVPTSEDQTSALSGGDSLQFASQPGTVYTVATVEAQLVTLTTPYSGIDDNFTGAHNVDSNAGSKGNLGTSVINKRTGAMSPVSVSAPTNAQLATPLAQFVDPQTAVPPPNPPLPPGTISAPTFLSGLFTQTLQLALAVPVTPQTITFA